MRCRSELWLILQVLNGSDSKQGPCHVVAPCPHDGRCPMDGTQSWCHFVQRFKRTAQQKHAKVGWSAPVCQDEVWAHADDLSLGPYEAVRCVKCLGVQP